MFIILLLLLPSLILHLVNFLLGRPKFPFSSTPELEHEEASQAVPSSSSSTPKTSDFDVFLSFRGEDTRNSFADHLFHGLKQKGIDTFRDEEKLEKGKPIAPKLLKAIEHSKFAVVVLSKDYASSTWCLDELAHIVQCMKEGTLDVFPVFYHIEASEVRKQTGNFGKAFAKHEENFNKEKGKVKKWRKALRKVANVAGWDLKNRKESEVIQEIANKISKALNDKLSSPNNDLVGMDSRIKKMEEYLTLCRLDDVRTIGIWGFGGIGKTTLATEVFKKIKNQFDASRFVSSVREESTKVNGLVGLQKSLSATLLYCDEDIQNHDLGIQLLRTRLRNKKVLIVLDDVDKLDQIKALADESWLGPGSRVIITTREKHELDTCGLLADNVYEVDKMKVGEDFQLFCRKAFKENDAPHDYKELSKKFVEYAGGIPLALIVLGSYLRGKNVTEWSEAFDRLDEDPEKDIMNVLKVSFDALKDTVKNIFLDIACFFNGEDQVRAKRILAGCRFYPESGMRDLLDKALIKINERNELWMHDLLRKMGEDIVYRQFPNEPGKRSRLWINENAYKRNRSWHDKVLAENTGTTAVEGLFLSLLEKEEIQLDADPFAKMRNLRLLKICNVNFSRCPEYFSKELRLLEWHEYPLESLPSSFKPCQLVELKMPNSRITQLWRESCTMMENLVQMDLSNCKFLIKTPDFRKVPNLERLILEGCEKLSEVHATIGDLQHLVVLNMKGCESLESLPYSISLESLKTFNLSGCSKLEEFPEIVGNMEALSELYLDETAIRKLPASIRQLRGLILLNLNGCKNLTSFPMAICSLTSLRYIYMSGCSRIDILPENLGSLEQLQELDACKTAITKMPGSILLLPKLKRLCFRGNKDVPVESSVFAEHKDELAESSVSTEHRDVQMESSVLFNEGTTAVEDIFLSLLGKEEIQLDANPLAKMCVNFSRIPEYFSKDLRLLEWDDYPLGSLPSSFKPCELVELKMPNSRFTHLWHESCNIMENLVQIDLSNLKFLIKTRGFRKVPNLERLILEGSEKLSEVHPTIGDLQRLVVLNTEGCGSLESLPHSISLESLKTFNLSGCSKLKEFPETGGNMEALSELYLDGTAIRKLLASIRKLRGLILLNLNGCKNLTSFPMAICSLTSSELLQELDACKTAITKVVVSVLSLPKLKRLCFRGKKDVPVKSSVSTEHKDELAESSVSTEHRDVQMESSVLFNEVAEFSRSLPSSFKPCELVELKMPNSRFTHLWHESHTLMKRIESLPSIFKPPQLVELKRLHLSGNGIVSLPESISQLSKLRELGLFRCSNLQSLPKQLPLSIKFIDVRHCPMLPISRNLTVWTAINGFSFMICENSDEDEDRRTRHQLAVREELDDELFFSKYIEDRIYHEKPFEIRAHFPDSTRVPNWCRHWMSGSSVIAKLPIDTEGSNGRCMGFALFVAFEIVENDNFQKSWELEKTVCHFSTHEGRLEHPIVFQNFEDYKVGSSYGLCCYEPRGGQFARQLNGGSRQFEASVTTNRPDLEVKGCGIHFIWQQDVADFVNNLTSTANHRQHPGFELWSTLESSGAEMVLVYDRSMGTSMNFPL